MPKYVQSWWEVPAIAHFCYAFRDVFNLIFFEIAELESAILNMQDPEMSISLEQLIIRLLQGCFDENDVRSDNWEEKLQELFEENCDNGNPVEKACFHFLSPRLKVEVLYKLCEFRLDEEDALDAIKDIPAEDMKASCVGRDSENNVYWYFCDERLYKEDPSIKPNKKTPVPEKIVNKNTNAKNGKRITRERKTNKNENKSWAITCYNTSDWEELVKRLAKSKNNNEKELVSQINNKYLPLLKEVVSEKDRLLRKRFLELAPKRNSSRISKVQAQRKLEEQQAEEAAEAKRAKQEAERAKLEAEKKVTEKEERRKRAEQREKVVQGRSLRAKQREMMRGYSTDDNESNSEETNYEAPRAKRACRTRTQQYKQNLSEESSSEDDDEALSDNNKKTNYTSRSPKRSSRLKSKNDNSDGEISTAASKSTVHAFSYSRVYVRPSGCRNTYNSNCNVQVDSMEQISDVSYKQFPENKLMKRTQTNVSKYNHNTKDTDTAYKENQNWYLKSCSKVTSSPSIIRLDYIKPSTKQQS